MARERRFATEKGGPQRLLIRWKGIWKNVEVLFDGQPLGEPIPNFKELKLGRSYMLPDGRRLDVRFEQNIAGGSGLAVDIDGRPVAGASNDPRTAVKTAAIIMWVIAGLNLLLGALAVALGGKLGLGAFGWFPLAAGGVMAVLAFFVHKYKSQAAILIAILIEVADALLILWAFTEGARIQPFPIIIRVFIIAALVRGYKGVSEARRLEKEELVDTFK